MLLLPFYWTMSDFGAGAAEFTDLWKSVSKGIDSKRKKAEKRMAGTTTSPLPNGEVVDRLK